MIIILKVLSLIWVNFADILFFFPIQKEITTKGDQNLLSADYSLAKDLGS